jgi:hypothetical protein
VRGFLFGWLCVIDSIRLLVAVLSSVSITRFGSRTRRVEIRTARGRIDSLAYLHTMLYLIRPYRAHQSTKLDTKTPCFVHKIELIHRTKVEHKKVLDIDFFGQI